MLYFWHGGIFYDTKNDYFPSQARKIVVAAYCRVSTNHPEQIGSLKIQESYFEAIIRAERYERDNPGPIRLYEKAGFVKVAEQGEVVVMRKELK